MDWNPAASIKVLFQYLFDSTKHSLNNLINKSGERETILIDGNFFIEFVFSPKTEKRENIDLILIDF